MLAFMKGYRTYAGLVITLLAVFGVTNYISPEEMEQSTKLMAELLGLAIAVYGRTQVGK